MKSVWFSCLGDICGKRENWVESLYRLVGLVGLVVAGCRWLWVVVGGCGGSFCSLLDPSGRLLGILWASLGGLWRRWEGFGGTWGHLGVCFGRLGMTRDLSGRLVASLWSLLVSLWPPWASVWTLWVSIRPVLTITSLLKMKFWRKLHF